MDELLAPILNARTLTDASLAVASMNATLWRPFYNETIEKEILRLITAPAAKCDEILLDPPGLTCPALRHQDMLMQEYLMNVSVDFRGTPELRRKADEALSSCWFGCSIVALGNEVC